MCDVDTNPEVVINKVQTLRLNALSQPDLTKEHLMLLRDLAKTAMDQTRISSMDDNAKAELELANNLAKLLQGSNNPFQSNEIVDVVPEVTMDELPDVKTVPGEMDTTLSTLTYEELLEAKDADGVRWD